MRYLPFLPFVLFLSMTWGQDASSLAPVLQLEERIGNDTWTWILTRTPNTARYAGAGTHHQTNSKLTQDFLLESVNRGRVVFRRQDGATYSGTLQANGWTIQGGSGTGAIDRDWRIQFAGAPLFASPGSRPANPAARQAYEEGIAHRIKGDPKAAEAAFTRAIAGDSNFADSYRQRALALSSQNRHKESLADFDRALQLDPRLANTLNGRAIAKQRLGDLAGAMADIQRALELDPSYANAYGTRAALRLANKDAAGSVADRTRALELDPLGHFHIYYRGLAREALGDRAGATADFERFLQLDPNNPGSPGVRNRLNPQAASAAPKPAETRPPARAEGPAPAGDWPEDPPRARPAPLPAKALAVANLRDDTTWKLGDTLWKRSPLPAPATLKAVPAVANANLDINHLTPAHFAAAVTAAKEAMRLVYGEMTAEEEKLFDAKWAPLFDYPCQEVIDYLNKLNPLLLEFLDLRAGYMEAARTYDETQVELVQALAAESQDDAVAAMETLRAQARLATSLAAGMSGVAARIEALGEFPNPLVHKGRARRTHDEAMRLLAPAAFEGEWLRTDGDRRYFRVIEDLGNGRWLVYHAASARYHQQTRGDGKPGFMGDHIWVVEEVGKGRYLMLAWVLVKQYYILEITGRNLKSTLVTQPFELNLKGSSATETLTLVTAKPANLSFPKQLGWDDVLTTARQMRTGKLDQYREWRTQYPYAEQGLAAASYDPALARRMYDEEVTKLKEEIARERAMARNGAEISYELNKVQGQTQNKEAFIRQRVAEIEQGLARKEAERTAQLRQTYLGEKPPPPPAAKPAAAAAPGPAEEDARGLEEERVHREERIKQIRADIDAFHSRAEQLRQQIRATPDAASKERLNWSLMVMERNLQDKEDELTTLQTGEWTRTPTQFDQYCFALEAERNRAAAEKWHMVARSLTHMEKQISLAPPEQRDRLRDFWRTQVTNETIAKHDFAHIEKVARSIFDQTQASREAEAAQYEEIAIGQDEQMVGRQRLRVGADVGMLVSSFFAGPPGRALYAAYAGVTGTLDGGPAEGVKQAAVAASNAVRVVNVLFEGYSQAVLQHLAEHAANPKAVQLDESGAGLNGALWAAGKEAAFQAAMRFVVQPVVTRMLGGPAPPPRPRLTAQQMIAQNQFRLRQYRGRLVVDNFIDKSKALAAAGKAGAPRAAIQQMRLEADKAYRDIKTDFFAKNYLKNLGRNNPKAVHYYNSFDRANTNQYLQRVQANAKSAGLSQQELALFSNSASKGGVGMDIDLGLREPPRFIVQAGRTVPNPAYRAWLNGLTLTENGVTTRVTPVEYQRRMQQVMEKSFAEHFGRAPDEAFLRFTYSGDAEAYKNLAYIGRKGLKTADFEALASGGPAYAKQAGDVSLFKVTELPHNHPSLGIYGTMQEQARGMVKDISTKLAGAPRGQAINPASPLAKAPPHVQQHFLKLRDAMDDFAANKMGPVEFEHRLKLLTGGRGLPEVAEQFGVALQGGVNQMRAR